MGDKPAEPTSPAAQRRGGLLVEVGDELAVVPVAAVGELVDAGVTTALPSAPAALLGVTSVRGAVLPVWEGQRLLGTGPAVAPGAAWVRLRLPAGSAVLVVARVRGLVDLPADREPATAWWAASGLRVPDGEGTVPAALVDVEALAGAMRS